MAGHLRADDIVIDEHGSRVFDAVWQVFCHAQKRFGCLPTLVEWDTDIAPLPVLLQQAARPPRRKPEDAGKASKQFFSPRPPPSSRLRVECRRFHRSDRKTRRVVTAHAKKSRTAHISWTQTATVFIAFKATCERAIQPPADAAG